MGLHSRKANKGRDYRMWHAEKYVGPALESIPVRQRERFTAREKVWDLWRVLRNSAGSIVQAPADEKGVMPRRTRRSIARSLFRKNWRKL
jgi:hypothetical protein